MSDKPTLYYDIEYEATGYYSGIQRVQLKDINHDEFSDEAEQDAIAAVQESMEDAELELGDGWTLESNSCDTGDVEEGTTEWTCCICGNDFADGYGNNPDDYSSRSGKSEPIKYQWGARCCDSCNMNIVIPNRIRNLKENT